MAKRPAASAASAKTKAPPGGRPKAKAQSAAPPPKLRKQTSAEVAPRRGAKRSAAAAVARGAADGPARKRAGGLSAAAIAARARTVLAALKDVPGTKEVRSIVKKIAEGRKAILQPAAVEAMGEVLNHMDDEMQAVLCDLQEKVDGADAERRAREQTQSAAEARLVELKREIVDRRHALSACGSAIEEAKSLVASAKEAQKGGMGELKQAEKTKATLEGAKREFEPVKEAPAEPKQIKALRKVGKEFGFHEVMLSALPAVLRKQPEKRRTFDGLTIKQLEVEIARHSGEAETAIQDTELMVAQQQEALQAAQDALAQAKRAQAESTKALADAEGSLEEGKEALEGARKHARAFQADLRRTTRELAQAQARLSAFRSGPLAAYEALKAELPPPSASSPAPASPSPAGDPDTAGADASAAGTPEKPPAPPRAAAAALAAATKANLAPGVVSEATVSLGEWPTLPA